MGRGTSQRRGGQALAFVFGSAALMLGIVVATATVGAQQSAQQQQSQPQQPVSQQPLAQVDLDLVGRAAKARSLAHAYADRLRTSLAQALKEGGPVRAIDACNTLAPELNATVTDGETFEINRTALRVRNPDNAPDPWEQAALESFQKAIAAGGDPKVLETYDVVTSKEGQRLFRYMRPITMHEQCLACHGPNVSHEVKSEVAKYYSDDKAIGFALGELRGAFSLVQQID